MLGVLPNNFQYSIFNSGGFLGTNSSPGLSVTTTANNVMSTWKNLITTPIAHDCFLLWLMITSSFVTANANNTIYDVGIDPAGGTSYTPIITSLLAGDALNETAGGISFLFPLFIPAGATVGIRGQSSYTSNVVSVVSCGLFGRPSRPELVKVGTVVDTYGVTAASSSGTSVAAGVSGAKGSWTAVGGTTTKEYFYAALGISLGQASAPLGSGVADLALDSAGNDLLVANQILSFSTNPSCSLLLPPFMNQRRIPVGSQFYVRAGGSNATAVTPNFAVYGVA